MRLRSEDFMDMQPIPQAFAFGRPGDADEPCVFSDNRNPHLAWSQVPSQTRSFALFVVDADAPTLADDVNKPGRRVAASLPRAEFVHWTMVDIPPDCHEIAAGSCANGVVARGRAAPAGPPGARQGINDYTHWFAGDADLSGIYRGYDGPCPPWNDERIHHYAFTVYALDSTELIVPEDFTLAAARAAIDGHVLACASLTGTYTLNVALRR